jgi:predicted PurR-regulated permease PerM
MSTVRPGRPVEVDNPTAAPAPAEAVNNVRVRHGRLRDAAARRGVPLATILVTVAVVVLTYLAGKLAYRIRDVLLMIAVAGFVSLILNPLVVALQRWAIRRRGWAVAFVATWTVLVFNLIRALVFAAVFNGVAAIPLIWFIDRIAADRDTMGEARSGRLSRSTLMLTFIGMAGSVVAISYIKG